MADIKVLYVEDAKSSGGTLRQALKDAQVNLVLLGGGFDALDELIDSGADAIVSCLDLSDLPGYQLSQLIKSSAGASKMPVVLFGTVSMGARIDPLWIKGSQCDLYVADRDIGNGTDVVKQLLELVEKSRSAGFNRSQASSMLKCRFNFSSSKVLESSQKLLDELLISRNATTLVSDMFKESGNRKALLDVFYRGAAAFIEADLVGLVVIGEAPWASFSADGVVSGSYKKLVDRLTNELELRSALEIDLRGELVEGTAKDLGSVQIVPVVARSRAVGALVVASKDRNSFSDQAIAFGEQLGMALGPLFELVLAKEVIANLESAAAYNASIDSLTGLYNLEFFVGFLQQQLLFSFRQRLPVAVAIIDIDNFEKINEQYGVEFGDGALMTIASRLLNITRSSDLIARYGSDQFAVVLPNTDVAGAKVLGEKVRSEVESIDFSGTSSISSGPVRITVSVGCASFNMEDLNPETILRDAKVALRKAKDEGRNRVILG
nr:diguanylate cyclase [Candidatus Melainabacteria bacterium]